jgi:integrase
MPLFGRGESMKGSPPFSVFKRSGRPCYAVQFRDMATGTYAPAVSTGQTSKEAAILKAIEWQPAGGKPKKGGGATGAKRHAVKTALKSLDLDREGADLIIGELKRQGLIKSAVIAGDRQDVDLGEYLLNFWTWGKSDYLAEKLRKNHGIHKPHVRASRLAIEGYWAPAFEGKLLGDVTREDVKAFIKTFENKGIGAGRKNGIIRAGLTALSYAYREGLIEKDVAVRHVLFSGQTPERAILTPELAKAVFCQNWNDNRAKLANMLAMVTGMRAGEIQGLRVQDLGGNCLHVGHSWNFEDGLKPPKNNETRTVELDIPGLLNELKAIAGQNPHGVNMQSFIFWGELKADKPMENRLFLDGLRAVLRAVGMAEAEVKKYTFHGWRHFYTAYMRDMLSEKLLRGQTGHKTLSMLNHYSDHRLVGDREKIQAAQRAAFGWLLPMGETLAIAGNEGAA